MAPAAQRVRRVDSWMRQTTQPSVYRARRAKSPIPILPVPRVAVVVQVNGGQTVRAKHAKRGATTVRPSTLAPVRCAVLVLMAPNVARQTQPPLALPAKPASTTLRSGRSVCGAPSALPGTLRALAVRVWRASTLQIVRRIVRLAHVLCVTWQTSSNPVPTLYLSTRVMIQIISS